MNIIADTHIFLWALSEPARLTAPQRVELETPANAIWLIAISVAQIAIKASLGKLVFNIDILQAARDSGFEILEYSAEDAFPLKELPFHHRDPFDRMLVSQAMTRDYVIMTSDKKFEQYPAGLVR